MKDNLPQIKQEGIFERIKKWFGRFFKGEKIEVKEPVQEAIEEIDIQVEKIKKEIFRESIQVKSKDKILALQRKIKEKQIEISDLTDEELDEIIELYKGQIEEKNKKLMYYKKIIIKNKKEE